MAAEEWPGEGWEQRLGENMEEWRPLAEVLANLSRRAGGPEVVCADETVQLTVPLSAGWTLREAFSRAAMCCGFEAALVDGKLRATKSGGPGDWIAAIGERRRIAFDGVEGDLIVPRGGQAAGRPWVWYAPSQGLLACNAWIMKFLLDRGIAVAMVGVGESWGNPKGREIYQRFYEHLVGERGAYGLAKKAVLWPQSRGGLMLYNWAAEHAEAVGAIGGIYTVCDLAAWAKKRQPAMAEAYGMGTGEFAQQVSRHNPVERLKPLVEAGVPIFHIHGDKDVVVPLEEHAGELVMRYRALGGRAELLVIPGKGHEAVKEYFQCRELAEFMAQQAADAGAGS